MMKDKISIIGPFPQPIHGMSLANQTLYDAFIHENSIDVDKFDITLSATLKNKNDQGKLQLRPVIDSLVNLIKLFGFMVKRRGGIFYFTPPQSVLGYLRLSPAIVLSKLVGGNCIVHFHGSRFKYYYEKSNFLLQWGIRKTFPFVDRFVLLGESIKRSHSSLLGMEKIVICKNGVSTPLNQGSGKRINKKKKTILFLSNLMKDKGIFDFLNAISKLSIDKYKIDIAGIIEESHQQEIESKLQELSGLVTYHGLVFGEEKHQLFSAADFFVLPSYDEGQPMSILEAYSYGCTVITTNVGGIPDIFSDSVNGKTVRVGDVEDIYLAIAKITSGELDSYHSNNIEVFYRLYTANAFCSRVLNICRGI